MSNWLKQSTAVTLKFGPFLDQTDGYTPETGLTITQADVRLSKNGGDIAQKNESSSATHDEIGYYDIALNTTDTNTLGTLLVAVNESGSLPVWQHFMIVPANVWDSLFGADKLQVHVDEMTAGIITAAAIATDAIGSDEIAASAVTEIQSGLASAADLATLAGYVDTEVAAIKAKTDNLPSDPADESSIQAAIAALNNISVANILAASIEGSFDLQETLRLILAVIVGKSSGGGTTTVVFRDTGDTKDRVEATVDGDGNRTAVTLDAS